MSVFWLGKRRDSIIGGRRLFRATVRVRMLTHVFEDGEHGADGGGVGLPRAGRVVGRRAEVVHGDVDALAVPRLDEPRAVRGAAPALLQRDKQRCEAL